MEPNGARSQVRMFERSYERTWGCEPATGICASPPCSRDWSNLLCTPIRCTSARRGEPVAATIGPVVDACGHQCIRRKLRRERAGDRVLGPSTFSNSFFSATSGSAGEAGRSLTMPPIMRARLSVLVAPQSNQRIAMCGGKDFQPHDRSSIICDLLRETQFRADP